jgi:hypothetical protein
MCLDKIFRLNTILTHVTEHEVIVLDNLDYPLGLEYPKVFAISIVLKQLAIWRGYALFAVIFCSSEVFQGKGFFIKYRRSIMQINFFPEEGKINCILFQILK